MSINADKKPMTGPCTVDAVGGSNNGAHDGSLAEKKVVSLSVCKSGINSQDSTETRILNAS